MAVPKSFTVVLRDKILHTDTRWEFNVPNLPCHPTLVKSITLVSTLAKQEIRLRMEALPQNRITEQERSDLLLLLSVSDFKLLETRKSGVDAQFAPARSSANYLVQLLKTGIVLNGTRYHFFGHSNSQLKSRSCLMYAASKDEIAAKVEGLGDFSKMKTVAKKAKRLGLLFSSAQMATKLQPDRCEDIDDIMLKDYIFTDGCGMISKQFAQLIVQRRNIVQRNKRYLPSVYQIRYRGYKGVLTLNPAMKGQTQVMFRQSMKKLKDVKDLSFSVVEYSKPYTFGFLNDEVVLLQHALGVSTETLLRKQDEYIRFLHNAAKGESRAAFCLLSFQSELKLAEKLLMDGFDAVRASVNSLVKQEFSKMVNKRDEQRCRIMIPKSRLLFGICEPTFPEERRFKLRPGTCFVRYTHDGDGEARTIINTEVMVTRNPCLHPGDLQKFQTVDVPEFSHLVDCIVFPVCGKRPSADLMSGGDLDGDKFFVTWDPDIIPRNISQAALYPGAKERIEFGKITGDDRAEFFAKYNNMSLGRIKNLYLKWARLKGSLSPECQELNFLFSQCVDGNRVRVPPKLEDPPESAKDGPTFILDALHDAASAAISNKLKRSADYNECPGDLLELLSCRDNLAISEFELIQLVLRKCEQTLCSFEDYAGHFNYAALNDEQQAWLLSQLPAARDTPNLVMNGLLQSGLVLLEELREFKLHHHNLHWKPVFASSTDHMNRFLPDTSRAMELFHKKLIILQPDERLTLIIYVPQKVPRATEQQVDASVRVFALPRSSGTNSVRPKVTPTKKNYKLYCDDSIFQLYEGKRANTFVFLTRGPVNASSFGDIDGAGERRRRKQTTLDSGENFDCRASVALNKINQAVQRHVGIMNRSGVLAAEIYVISNRDVESMRYLDQWLEFVDTEEVLPLFDPIRPEYQVPTLRNYGGKVSERTAKVVWDQDLAHLKSATSNEITEIFKVLSDVGQRTQMITICMELLEIGKTSSDDEYRYSTLNALLKLLPSAAFLTQVVLESQLWRSCKDQFTDESSQLFPDILYELVLSTTHLKAFVKPPFKTLLREMKQISMHQVAELFELVALSVGEPEFALDLLIECLRTEASRLLVARPLEIEQFFDRLIGITMDHVDEASTQQKSGDQMLSLRYAGSEDGQSLVEASTRIDLRDRDTDMRTGDHIRLVAANAPTNAPLQSLFVMDALVVSSEQGSVKFRCIHHPPPFLAECAWNYQHCGSFVTSKVMLDSVLAFYSAKQDVCGLYDELVAFSSIPARKELDYKQEYNHQKLNASQNRALNAAMRHPLVLLWGPPGTGKTQTIVIILQELLEEDTKSRILVTAPTHNAVDNILQRFLDEGGSKALSSAPLRVATSLTKVSPSLREFTCDAMVGHDLSESYGGRREAQERVKRSRIIFTTCIGAALGLLRSETFEIMVVDEASQQTEPATLAPLVKGCSRAILVGDHVQLRATVQKHAALSAFDVSLFERLYTKHDAVGITKVMLDTQYRMHPDICSFSSSEFYASQLHSAAGMELQKLPLSQFPWPTNDARTIFIPSASLEDLGNQSKSNQGQVQLCQHVWKLLSSVPKNTPEPSSSPSNDIAILTPYTRQRGSLGPSASSIDGFQGREADIFIFVSVRSNANGNIGFLKDLRRLNVAMTRAKAGVIIIGNKLTLTANSEDETEMASKRVWRKLISQCTEVQISIEEK